MYETSTEEDWLGSCAISSDGGLIYITDNGNDRLITVDSKGHLLATIDIKHAIRPHVMPSGLVLVVCRKGTFLQISQDGKSTRGTFQTPAGATLICDVIYYQKKQRLLAAGKTAIVEMTIELSEDYAYRTEV